MDVRIVKKADDPLGVVRVSVGGGARIGGVYCVYRGALAEAVECLETALAVLRTMRQEPEIEQDEAMEIT